MRNTLGKQECARICGEHEKMTELSHALRDTIAWAHTYSPYADRGSHLLIALQTIVLGGFEGVCKRCKIPSSINDDVIHMSHSCVAPRMGFVRSVLRTFTS